MLSNYFKLAFRSLWKNKTTAMINIAGLGLGLSVCMLILLYVSHEFSFDRCHEKSTRIFNTRMKLKMGENDLQMNLFPPDFGQKIKAANPEVAELMRFTDAFRETPKVKSEEGRQFLETRFCFSDPSIFRVLTFQFLSGDPLRALEAPDAVCISQPMASKYFGEADPMGKTLLLNDKDLLRVTGVFEKMPANSSLQFDFVAALSAHERIFRRENPNENFDVTPLYQAWFLLDQPGSKSKVAGTIAGLQPASDDPVFGKATYELFPLDGVHLGSNWAAFSNGKYISLFMVVAAMVLFLALFNYMNLSTARASARTREVGVRKVLGAHRGQLARQFYGESALVSALGFVFGLAIFQVTRPTFYQLLDLEIDEAYLSSALFISVLVGLFLLCVLLAGSYPAFMLSRFSPTQVLKGSQTGVASGSAVRKVLMVVQFAVSTLLIIGTLGVKAQVDYMQEQNIGLNREQVMVVPLTKGIGKHFPAFRQAVSEQTGVKKVSVASFAFFQGGWDMWFVKSPSTQEDIGISALTVDEHFFETLEIQWETSPVRPQDMAPKKQLLINKSGIETLKIAGDPVGQHIDMQEGPSEIVGVTKDFNFIGLQHKIEGMLFAVVPDSMSMAGRGGHLYVRLDPSADLSSKVAAIAQVFKQFDAAAPFDYYFLDEAFSNQYRSERRMGYLFSAFSGVAIFLACLGLFGLAAFAAERRSKEIGVRKVLGATVASITALLAKDFIRLVLLAFFLAIPFAYYFLQRWLADFAYHIEIEWWMFAITGVVAVAIAFLTVSFQSIRAALANPVKSLRNE